MAIEREPVCTLWVCDTCAIVRENNEPWDREGPDPWNLLPDDDVTLGLRLTSHECGLPETDIASGECGCERLDFSGRDCDACGTTLAGGRWAYTLWLPVGQ